MNAQQIMEIYNSGEITQAEAAGMLINYFRSINSANPEAKMQQYLPGFDSAQAVGVTGGGLTDTGIPMGPVTQTEGGFLGENPQLAWNRAYDLPSVGANPFQQWLSNQAGPAYSAYAGQNVADIMAGKEGTSYGDYLGASDLGKMPQRALSTLRGLKGAGSETQQDWMNQLVGGDVGGNLSQIFQGALQGRGYASPFARAASRNVPGYQEKWAGQTLGGSRGDQSFLDYLMQQFQL